jgi:hypothetical protein
MIGPDQREGSKNQGVYFFLAFKSGWIYNARDECTSSLKGTVRSRDLPMEDEGLSKRATLTRASHIPFPFVRRLPPTP